MGQGPDDVTAAFLVPQMTLLSGKQLCIGVVDLADGPRNLLA
jgi:hypothetical protein